MIVYPAIDLAKGKCVRLLQGRRDDETVYAENPGDVARQWESQGARFLHLVDLDGAFDGTSQNLEAVKEILAAIQIPAQLGGGIRSMESIAQLLELGLHRVILGTALLENPDLAGKAIQQFGPERIVVGIDARKGRVAVRGWTKETETTPIDLAKQMKQVGATTFVYTDIARDGMLSGPNLPALKTFAAAVEGGVIASGGISTLDDVRDLAALARTGVAGMITGKALYENKFQLVDAIRVAGEKVS